MTRSQSIKRERLGRWRTKSRGFWNWDRIRPRLIQLKPKGFWGWVSFAPLSVLWLVFLIDIILWYSRGTGDFSSKLNFASHLWLYMSAAGLTAALAAVRSPGILRYPPPPGW